MAESNHSQRGLRPPPSQKVTQPRKQTDIRWHKTCPVRSYCEVIPLMSPARLLDYRVWFLIVCVSNQGLSKKHSNLKEIKPHRLYNLDHADKRTEWVNKYKAIMADTKTLKEKLEQKHENENMMLLNKGNNVKERNETQIQEVQHPDNESSRIPQWNMADRTWWMELFKMKSLAPQSGKQSDSFLPTLPPVHCGWR